MANYDSIYTGQEVDEAITTARSFVHTPVEIDTAVSIVEDLTVTPTQINNACNDYQNYPSSTEIGNACDFVAAVESTPAEIDDTVVKVNDITASATEINNAARLLFDNSATVGQVLTADGSRACSWQTPAASPSLYHHTATFTRIADWISRWAVEWIDADSSTSATATTTLFYLSTYYRNVNCPKIISGEFISDEGAQATVNGFYFETGTSKYVLVSAEQELAEEKFDNFNGWSYAQSTRQII